jgi:hypothetical protein
LLQRWFTEANYGIPRLFKGLPSIKKEIRMQICHCQWLVVASQQGFRDGVKMSRRFHEKVFLPKAICRVSRRLLVWIRSGLLTSVTSWFVAALVN